MRLYATLVYILSIFCIRYFLIPISVLNTHLVLFLHLVVLAGVTANKKV